MVIIMEGLVYSPTHYHLGATISKHSVCCGSAVHFNFTVLSRYYFRRQYALKQFISRASLTSESYSPAWHTFRHESPNEWNEMKWSSYTGLFPFSRQIRVNPNCTVCVCVWKVSLFHHPARSIPPICSIFSLTFGLSFKSGLTNTALTLIL